MLNLIHENGATIICATVACDGEAQVQCPILPPGRTLIKSADRSHGIEGNQACNRMDVELGVQFLVVVWWALVAYACIVRAERVALVVRRMATHEHLDTLGE